MSTITDTVTVQDTGTPEAPAPEVTPDGVVRFVVKYAGEVKTFELVVADVTFGEARAIEKVTDATFKDIGAKKDVRERTVVLQALLWVSMKRQIPMLAFKELDDIAINSIEWPDADEEDEAADVGEEEQPDGVVPFDAADTEA